VIDTLKTLFDRDLDRLASEINTYNNASNLWVKDGQVNNSGGTLCLHLCGNLQHFVGSILGNSGYVRDRVAEFSDVHSRESLIQEIETTKKAVQSALEKLSPNALSEKYPIEVFGSPMTVQFFLLHLQGHLNYHLGQISYHRRLLDR